MRWALYLRLPVKLPHAAARVLFYLADRAKDDGTSVFPAVDTIAEHIEGDRKTVQRSLKLLCELRVLVHEQASKGGRKKTNQYRINLNVGQPAKKRGNGRDDTPDLFPETVAETGAPRPGFEGDRPASRTSRNRGIMPPFSAETGAPCPINRGTMPPYTINTQESKGKTLESPTGPKLRVVAGTAHAIPGTRLKPSGDDGFDAFYAAYPRHTGKEDALKVWRKLIKAGTDPAEIMAGLARFRHNPDPQFIMEPRKWLHGKRWQDEVSADFYASSRLRSQPTSAEDVYERALRAAGVMDGGLLR